MTISRREFFLATSGAAAGFILPSYYEKVFNFVENFGEPLIVSPKHATNTLIAIDWVGDGSYELNLGDPHAEPNFRMTLREYANRYCGGEQGYIDMYLYGEDPVEVDFDSSAYERMVATAWTRIGSPMARAYKLLENLDLGPRLTGVDSIGEIDFIDGPCPGNDYLAAHALGLVSVSLLQQRLNDLEAGIRIEMGSPVLGDV